MGARKFNFAPKFLQNGGFLVQNFVFLEENFTTRRTLSDRLKLGREQLLFLSPLCHDATAQRRG